MPDKMIKPTRLGKAISALEISAIPQASSEVSIAEKNINTM